MAKSMADIADLLKKTRFKHSLFGLNEADVWNKLSHLQAEYAALIAAEHDKCQALLNEREELISRQNESIRKLQMQLKAGRTDNVPPTREGISDG